MKVRNCNKRMAFPTANPKKLIVGGVPREIVEGKIVQEYIEVGNRNYYGQGLRDRHYRIMETQDSFIKIRQTKPAGKGSWANNWKLVWTSAK